MTAIVLIAGMVDRSALKLRNLALAALGVMLVAPEAVVHPSFRCWLRHRPPRRLALGNARKTGTSLSSKAHHQQHGT
jgi:hypothetical protein